MLKYVDHIAFAVSDLDRSLKFYQDVLGLEFILRRVWDEEYVRRMLGIPDATLDIALLKLPGDKGSPLSEKGALKPKEGDTMLELIAYQHPKGNPIESRTNTPGNAHLCFMVDDLQDVFERLKSADVDFVSDPIEVDAGPNKGRKAVFFRDPDGIFVQLMQP